eukprot:jgi/Mesvir1/18806/Mv01312-RA.1
MGVRSRSHFDKIVASRRKVFNGTAFKTRGGLKRNELTKNDSGDIVSIRKREMGQKHFSNVQDWNALVQAINGSKRGAMVYDKVRNEQRRYQLRDAMKEATIAATAYMKRGRIVPTTENKKRVYRRLAAMYGTKGRRPQVRQAVLDGMVRGA